MSVRSRDSLVSGADARVLITDPPIHRGNRGRA
jgi:hypothetical protein